MDIQEEDCTFCNPILKKEYDLNIICPNYNLVYRKKLDKEIMNLLKKIFSEQYYLTNELIEIIISFIELIKINKISKINADSVLYFSNCITCSNKLLEFYDKNICSKHYLPMCIFPENF